MTGVDREGKSPPAGTALCRDCLSRPVAPSPSARCPDCGSPRLVSHPELFSLAIAHVDCDAFYAAIEKRDNPDLADKPLIVGGGKRGVVATACYIARTYGVRSAMPMFKALEACPHAVVVPPDMAKYAKVGRAVRDLMLALTPLVEPLSIDEAFLDLSGTERAHRAPPAAVLARFQCDLEMRLGITASVGLSHNKFLAKIASDLDKPRGFSAIGQAETLGFLAAQPVSLIWGVGKAMQAQLARDGLTRISDLQKRDETDLAKGYGAMGIRLAKLARGIDPRDVVPEREAKIVSAETTFERDLSDPDALIRHLCALSERVSERLKEGGLSGRVVVLKLKTADFKLRMRQQRLDSHTNLADRVFASGRSLLANEADGTRFRLIGIGVSDLGGVELAGVPRLIDTDSRRERAEHAIDDIRHRFGRERVGLGLTFEINRRSDDDSP